MILIAACAHVGSTDDAALIKAGIDSTEIEYAFNGGPLRIATTVKHFYARDRE